MSPRPVAVDVGVTVLDTFLAWPPSEKVERNHVRDSLYQLMWLATMSRKATRSLVIWSRSAAVSTKALIKSQLPKSMSLGGIM